MRGFRPSGQGLWGWVSYDRSYDLLMIIIMISYALLMIIIMISYALLMQALNQYSAIILEASSSRHMNLDVIQAVL